MQWIGRTLIFRKVKQADRSPLCAAALVLLALGLRLYHLGADSMWVDEGFSLRDATGLDLVGETRPLYFLLLSGWLNLGAARSEFLLRLPSAVFGAAAVWALYAVGRRLVGIPAALLASTFMSLSVLQINHSREVRMYSFTVLISLLAVYFLLLSLEHGKRVYAVGYLTFALAALLTFPLTLLLMAAQGLFLLLYVRALWPRSLVLICGQLAVVSAWLPWLLNNMHASAGYSEGYASTLDRPSLLGVVTFLGKFFLWKWSEPGQVFAAGALGFSVMVFVIALWGLRRVTRTDIRFVFVWLWLVVPVVGMATLSYALANMWMVHYLIATSPAFFLLVSYGICSVGNRYLAVTAALAVLALTLGRLGLYYARPVRPQWRPAIEYIHANERPGDVIGIYYAGNQYVFRYYYQGRARWMPLGSDDITKEHFCGWNDRRVSNLLRRFPLSGKRFWLVLSSHTYAGGFHIINYVKKHYRVLDHRNYHLLEVYLFDAGGQPVPVESRAQAGRDW